MTHSRPDQLVCPLCSHAREHGWWGRSDITHCRDCHRTWSRTSRDAHCASCHAHFGSSTSFDRHLVGPPTKMAKHVIPPGLTQDEGGTWRRPAPPQAVRP